MLSKTKITVDGYGVQYENVDDLVKDMLIERDVCMLQDWGGETIRFPDGEVSSANVVEVVIQLTLDEDEADFYETIAPKYYQAKIIIGHANHYRSYVVKDWNLGLLIADKLAKDWLSQSWDMDDFLNYCSCAIDCGFSYQDLGYFVGD